MAARDPVQEAERIRAEIWGDSFPVDPVYVARALGIEVLDASLPSDVSGAIEKQAGHDPRILLNARDSTNRKRFTCAHEIGHFVLRSDDPEAYEYVDLRGSLASQGQDPDEIFANQFAANLLMPADEVRRLQDAGTSITSMIVKFGVSQEAMRFRLTNLGLVTV